MRVAREFLPIYEQGQIHDRNRGPSREEAVIWSRNLMVVEDLEKCTFQPELNGNRKHKNRDIGLSLYNRGQDKHDKHLSESKKKDDSCSFKPQLIKYDYRKFLGLKKPKNKIARSSSAFGKLSKFFDEDDVKFLVMPSDSDLRQFQGSKKYSKNEYLQNLGKYLRPNSRFNNSSITASKSQNTSKIGKSKKISKNEKNKIKTRDKLMNKWIKKSSQSPSRHRKKRAIGKKVMTEFVKSNPTIHPNVKGRKISPKKKLKF